MDVLKEFQAAIEIEDKKNSEDFEEQKKLPLDERVAKGVTMSNLKVELDFSEALPNPVSPGSRKYISSVKILCDNNISKFKEGDAVLLSNGVYRFELEIEEDSAENFILKPNEFNVKNCHIDINNYPKNNWEINTVKIDIGKKLLLTAAKILEDNRSTLNKIDNFLNGKARNDFDLFSQSIGYLNDSQNSAYLKAINASDFCIIQGPPGTGKTETISNIVKHLVDKGLKVFVTAPTHTAINNCLNAIGPKVKDAKKVIKIGKKAQNKEIIENNFIRKESRFDYYRSNYNGKGIAIGATAYSLS